MDNGIETINKADNLFYLAKTTYGHETWRSPNSAFYYTVRNSVFNWLIGYLENRMNNKFDEKILKDLNIRFNEYKETYPYGGQSGGYPIPVEIKMHSLEDLCIKCSEYEIIFVSIMESCKMFDQYLGKKIKNMHVENAIKAAETISNILPIEILREKIHFPNSYIKLIENKSKYSRPKTIDYIKYIKNMCMRLGKAPEDISKEDVLKYIIDDPNKEALSAIRFFYNRVLERPYIVKGIRI
jgi:hypothetical protein